MPVMLCAFIMFLGSHVFSCGCYNYVQTLIFLLLQLEDGIKNEWRTSQMAQAGTCGTVFAYTVWFRLVWEILSVLPPYKMFWVRWLMKYFVILTHQKDQRHDHANIWCRNSIFNLHMWVMHLCHSLYRLCT